MEVYDSIGRSYSATRHADSRIVQRLITLLNLPAGATVADIGAGTGNYSVELAVHGYNVIAVEPSAMMRNQGRTHTNLHWMAGIAEKLPLQDNSVDGVISTLTIHHFSDVETSFKEMIRVVRPGGPIVLFVSDPRLCQNECWLVDYFHPIFTQSYEVYPELQHLVETLAQVSGCQVQIETFLLPPDMEDRFFMTGWRHPQLYLDPLFRQGVSPLANAPVELVERCVRRLRYDLAAGIWQGKYGGTLNQSEYDGGYRFLIAQNG
ncbi:class I SAM-dependent methyltransferase [Alicyclobacillus sp. ALC3]|uniref:class I SAM-dependent methyltransferase n=1 Tax=Alicyclobacillus sp. ALC3 TaxID=2796143 RepID=UPI0023785B4D|nr:class I SAM-dependent methyltransferase [Alicyclobacillus sp. ALC3]WDL96690.1 class I SAM-dependent methyltransferase [Alicyclobacillus sp. ALC3]